MSLAIFDLDNTLIGGDSDHLWGEFLIEEKLVDAAAYRQQNDLFYQQYQQGTLNIHDYLKFALQPLTRFPSAELASLHSRFMTAKIHPIMLPRAADLIDQHRQRGDTLLIITATNRFITEPIARYLGIDNLLASDAELLDGRYTGRPQGVPCFQHGKVTRLYEWLETSGENLNESHFYSDSANDIPLLELVHNPVAVDPDPKLAQYAEQKGIPIISLR